MANLLCDNGLEYVGNKIFKASNVIPDLNVQKEESLRLIGRDCQKLLLLSDQLITACIPNPSPIRTREKAIWDALKKFDIFLQKKIILNMNQKE